MAKKRRNRAGLSLAKFAGQSARALPNREAMTLTSGGQLGGSGLIGILPIDGGDAVRPMPITQSA